MAERQPTQTLSRGAVAMSKQKAAQRRREAAGVAIEAEARKRSRPTHAQLMLPLIGTIVDAGGRVKPAEIYEQLADRLDVPPEVRSERRAFSGGGTHSLWARHVRWAQHSALLRGYLARPERGLWEVTSQGRDMLQVIRPGYVVTVFETDAGVALWATAEAAAGVIQPASVNLIYVSPVYPISTAREYGGLKVPEWLDWMQHLGQLWHGLLQDDGSLMVNLGTVFTPGAPLESTYLERFVLQMVDDLGWHLAGRHHWYNPLKLPSPMPWVVLKRKRVKPAVETIYWFSKNRDPKADNRRVLRPYSERALKGYIGKQGEAMHRASGYSFGEKSWSKDNGGSIPPNLIIANGVPSQDDYRRRCREAALPAHPAAFPAALPEFGIKLTTEPGDLVYDPMAGSGTTAAVAEALGRRWLTSEQALAYIEGAALRHDRSPGFRRLLAINGGIS